MRLYTKRGIYYVEFERGKSRSLKTRDKRTAQSLFIQLKKKWLTGKLLKLETSESISLSSFRKKYITDPERKDLSTATIKADELALKLFQQATGDLSLNNLRKSHISDFKAVCSARGVKPVSINTYLRHIRAALNYAYDNEFITNPPPKIKFFKIGSKLPRIINLDDLKKIQIYAQKNNPEMARIIHFALYTGTRRSEIINARYEHISNNSIVIHGKGNKERLIPLVDHAREILKNQDIGKIFSYKNGHTISNYYRKITRACGVVSRFHDLRHTSATQMLRNGIPLEVVQKILGHTEIRTTQIYAKVVEETMRKELTKLSF